MSWDVEIYRDGNIVVLPEKHNITGGTYVLGGTREANLNITYNYSQFYNNSLIMAYNNNIGLKCLDGVSVRVGIDLVAHAVRMLEGAPSDNYWDATEGNAKAALGDLLKLFSLCSNDDIIRVS